MSETLSDTDTPGRLLAAARVRAGLTLADVSDRSRVPIDALRAIDADDHRDIGAPIYVKGFIKLYAREVGLDPAVVLGLLDRAVAERMIADQPVVEEPRRVPRRRRNRAAFSIVGAALVAALLLVVLFSVSQTPNPSAAMPADAEVQTPTIVPLPAEVVEETTPE